MPRRRQSFDPGHRRKFLVVVDDTPECDRAVTYAARRAARTDGSLLLLAVLDLADVQSQWFGVAELMRAEATDEARARLAHFAARARVTASVEAGTMVREGRPVDEIVRLIEEDEDIAILVLAAAGGEGAGPGPLLAALAHAHWAGLSIPVTIVPGALSDEEIEALA